MDDRPEDRRRRGPLDEGEGRVSDETTQYLPRRDARRESGGDEDRTQRVPLDEDESRTRSIPREEPRAGRPSDEDRTRAFRPTGGPTGQTTDRTSGGNSGRKDEPQGQTVSFPQGYLEANDERHARLRDMYGGTDWLAGFVGWLVSGISLAFLSLLAGILLVPLGFSLDIGPADLGATVITGLVIVAVVIFVSYFFGGYVAGRMARFDGGRNGALVVVWSLLLGLVIGVAATFIPGEVFQFVSQFTSASFVPALGGLGGLGGLGLGILVGAVLIALLAGFLGGRSGSRFHTSIDRTT